MATFTNGLAAFTEKTRELLIEGVFLNDSFADFTPVEGMVGATIPLTLIDSDLYQQTSDCALATSGTTTLSKRDLTLARISYTKDICVTELKGYNIQNAAGSDPSQLAPEVLQKLTESFINNIRVKTEKDIFTGAVSGGDKINGIYTILTGATHAHVAAAYSGVTVTSSNIIAILDSMIDNTPEAAQGKSIQNGKPFVFNCSLAIFNMYKKALKALTVANQSITNIGKTETDIVGWEGQFKLKAQAGLVGKNYIFGWNPENVVFGTASKAELANGEWGYDGRDRMVYFHADLAYGVQIGIPAEVVSNL